MHLTFILLDLLCVGDWVWLNCVVCCYGVVCVFNLLVGFVALYFIWLVFILVAFKLGRWPFCCVWGGFGLFGCY